MVAYSNEMEGWARSLWVHTTTVHADAVPGNPPSTGAGVRIPTDPADLIMAKLGPRLTRRLYFLGLPLGLALRDPRLGAYRAWDQESQGSGKTLQS
jgi:hypothetical protein